MNERAPLPDIATLDIEQLRALVLSQQEQLTSRDAEIEHLKLLIAKLRRMRFGRSSEKLDRQIEQLELKLEELQVSQAETAPIVEVKEASPKTSGKTGTRRALPEHLPREVRRYLPKQEACPDCGGKLKPLG